MWWSIDSGQNRVFADQYHLTVPRAQVSTHRGRVFFEVICWQITSFKWSQAQVYFFQWFIWNMLCLCSWFMSLWPRTIKILISNWPRTRKFSQFFKNTGGEDRPHTHRYVGKNLKWKPVERKKLRPDLFSKNLFSRSNLLWSWMWWNMCSIFWVYI